jgi:GAF domain-containing protein
MQCPRCQHENRPQAEFCEECGTPLTANPSAPPSRSHAEITGALSEALEQQTATSEILRVISSSPTDVQPVFDAIVESAVRLCEARYGAVFGFDGELVHHVAHHNFSPAWLNEYPMRPTRTRISGRAILSGSVVQIPDVALDPDYGSPHAARLGFRSLLGVPILRSGAPVGSIVIYRREPGPFSDRHVALLQTFADQAVNPSVRTKARASANGRYWRFRCAMVSVPSQSPKLPHSVR